MEPLKSRQNMRRARIHINQEETELFDRIDYLLITRGKLESLRSQSINLQPFYERLVDFTDRVLNNNIFLKRMLKRLYYFKVFSKNRKKQEKEVKDFRFIVRNEEINLNLYKQNMQRVCKINNHSNQNVCIFCL